ncbi:MAG: peptidylprolyl isomerase [Pseudomonadales bacterium]
MAESLREEVVGGRDFEEIAKLQSDDPGSALSGGDLGWNRAGTFVPEFEKKITESTLDEVTEVFETTHGFHFLQVTGRRIEDFSENFCMGQAESYLRNQRWDEELQSWITEIREDAFVEIRI